MSDQITGKICYHPQHASPEESYDFTGTAFDIFEELDAQHTTQCDCCQPSFITADGLTAVIEGNRLHWSLAAWGTARLGLITYGRRPVGYTDNFK